MELTRRDVLAALAAAGAGCAAPEAADEEALDDDAVETLAALAEVLYPGEVTGVEAFVREYSLARVTDRPAHRGGMVAALETLDEQAEGFHDAPFAALAPGERDEVLRGLAVDEADPEPGGEPRQRVRYYLVNELLFALYSTPTGGELVGIENPPGHPGGAVSYRAPGP